MPLSIRTDRSHTKLILLLESMNTVHGHRDQASPDGDGGGRVRKRDAGGQSPAPDAVRRQPSAARHRGSAGDAAVPPRRQAHGGRPPPAAASSRPPGASSTTSRRPRTTCGGTARGEASVIRVCAQCNTGYHWLPPLIDAFRRQASCGRRVDRGRVHDAAARGAARRPARRRHRHRHGPQQPRQDTAALRGRACRDRRARPSLRRAGLRQPERACRRAVAALLEFARRQLHDPEDPQAGGRRRQARVVRDAHGSDPRDGEGAARRQRHADMGDCAGAPRRRRPGRPHHRFGHPPPVASGDAHAGGPRASRGRVHRFPGRARHAGPPPAADRSAARRR